MTRYLELSIKEINEKLKNKEIKPIDLVNEAFDKIELYKEYNAFITLNKEEAIKTALESISLVFKLLSVAPVYTLMPSCFEKG